MCHPAIQTPIQSFNETSGSIGFGNLSHKRSLCIVTRGRPPRVRPPALVTGGDAVSVDVQGPQAGEAGSVGPEEFRRSIIQLLVARSRPPRVWPPILIFRGYTVLVGVEVPQSGAAGDVRPEQRR